MTLDVKKQVKEAKEKESFIHFEFYRLIKNAILKGLEYSSSKCKFVEVLPEFSVKEKRADIVVFAQKYKTLQPYLVIETKPRVYTRPGPSAAAALRRVRSYAKNLRMLPGGFFGVYDGWILLVFRIIDPYLITAAGKISEEDEVETLLMGLEEYAYSGRLNLLNSLPKVADPNFLIKRVFPSLVKEFTKEEKDREDFLKKWEERLIKPKNR
jgi:hypothetical protein